MGAASPASGSPDPRSCPYRPSRPSPPPPPPSWAGVSKRISFPDESDESAAEFCPSWAYGRKGSDSTTVSLRNRRRSRGHLAAIDTHGRVGSISAALATAATPPQSRSQSRSSLVSPQTLTDMNDLSDMTSADADSLLPLLSPTAATAAGQHSPDRAYLPHQAKSLAGIATRSFCLGAALMAGSGLSLSILVFTSSPLWRLPFFLATLAAFHFLEFLTTAMYNTRSAEVGSFLLTANGPAYALAHTAAVVEFLVANLVWPRRAWAPYHTAPLLCALGLALVLVGQVVRSAAMVQAGTSFNHQVQRQRDAGHMLVTTGIYGRLRHPSYFGFFYWALGTQLVLGNVLCSFAYAAALWHFFSTRIRGEEKFLVDFFGKEYEDYRRTVGTKIPFVS